MEQTPLKSKVLTGIYWSFIESGGRNVFRVVIGLVLARLLEPTDYGLIGMIAIFISLAGVLIDSGLSTALIQNTNSGASDFSTVFFFNIGAGILFYLILFLIAPLIAIFFNQPLLINITRVIALNFVITSFGIVQNAIFSKQMNFKTLTKVSLIAIFISGSISIVMAIYGFGVWSLVAQTLTMAFISTLLLWWFSAWKPSLYFNKNSFRALYKFGSKLMHASIINTVFQNIYLIVIGKLYTTIQLGFYTKAESLAKAPVQNLYSIFQKVLFPSFSLLQHDNPRLKQAFKRVLIASAYIIFPIMLASVSIARPFILLILTDKWSGSILYFQLLCFSFMLYPFHALNLNILNTKGRSDLVLKLEYIKKGIIILAILITFKFGIIALIIGHVASSIFAFFINTLYSGKLIDYPVSEQIKDLFPYFAISAVTALILYLSVFIFGEKYFLQIFIQISFGAVFYFLVSRWLNLSGYTEVRNIASQYYSRIILRFRK